MKPRRSSTTQPGQRFPRRAGLSRKVRTTAASHPSCPVQGTLLVRRVESRYVRRFARGHTQGSPARSAVVAQASPRSRPCAGHSRQQVSVTGARPRGNSFAAVQQPAGSYESDVGDEQSLRRWLGHQGTQVTGNRGQSVERMLRLDYNRCRFWPI